MCNKLKNLESVQEKIRLSSKNEGFLVLNNFNLMYLLGLSGSSALLITDRDNLVYSHEVNYAYLEKERKDFTVVRIKPGENILKKIMKEVKNLKIKNLILDSARIETWNTLTKVSNRKIELEVDSKLIQELRKIKTSEEIKHLRKAGELTMQGMQVASEIISPGIKESEIAAEIEYAMRKNDFGGIAFETIVASGKTSAFPHGSLSSKEINKGDLVVVDVGAKYNYYCSDMSRTFVVGKTSTEQKRIIKTVQKAQKEGMHALRDGVEVKYVDNISRKIINKEGYGNYFVHSLGHGVGLEVHELPILSSVSKDTLIAGNVITVEPGIYIPDYGGVRIEDTVLIKKDSIEKLTYGVNNFEL